MEGQVCKATDEVLYGAGSQRIVRTTAGAISSIPTTDDKQASATLRHERSSVQHEQITGVAEIIKRADRRSKVLAAVRIQEGGDVLKHDGLGTDAHLRQHSRELPEHS